MGSHEPLLSLRHVAALRSGAAVIHDVSMDVHEGEVVALLGANGAGKTTLLDLISGFIAPSSGSLYMRGESLAGLPPYQTFRRGVVQVSQSRDLFPELSVRDNLELGATTRKDDWSADWRQVLDYFPRLEERLSQPAGTLSGGEQQMVAIGRALMGRPRILLLDEPSAGLAPRFVDEIRHIMLALKERGATMLIVEQNIGLALAAADRYHIMRGGRLVHSGDKALLGPDHAALVSSYYL